MWRMKVTVNIILRFLDKNAVNIKEKWNRNDHQKNDLSVDTSVVQTRALRSRGNGAFLFTHIL